MHLLYIFSNFLCIRLELISDFITDLISLGELLVGDLVIS